MPTESWLAEAWRDIRGHALLNAASSAWDQRFEYKSRAGLGCPALRHLAGTAASSGAASASGDAARTSAAAAAAAASSTPSGAASAIASSGASSTPGRARGARSAPATLLQHNSMHIKIGRTTLCARCCCMRQGR